MPILWVYDAAGQRTVVNFVVRKQCLVLKWMTQLRTTPHTIPASCTRHPALSIPSDTGVHTSSQTNVIWGGQEIEN